jgi:hypothetical protein
MRLGIAMAVRDFECLLCRREFSRMTADFIIMEEQVCDECLKDLCQLEGDECARQVSRRLEENASWLQEHFRIDAQNSAFAGRVVQSIENLKKRGMAIDAIIQYTEGQRG